MAQEAQTGESVDLHRVLLEIDEEVRAKRASGELPRDLERELDLVFARYAPAGAVGDDFGALVDRAEQQAFIDLLAPNESSRPGVPHVKRVVQKVVRWYLRYVVEQVTGFAHSITKAVRILGERTTRLEQLTVSVDELNVAFHDSPKRESEFVAAIVSVMQVASGRVAHLRAGDGELVKALTKAGVDAYGVDPAADLVSLGTAASIDLRSDSELGHLASLRDDSLSGLVLSGCVDYLPRGAQVELANLAADKLVTGGALAVVSADPKSWAANSSPVVVDLAPGSPLHPETWKYLLCERGFKDVAIEASASGGAVLITAVR